MSTPAGKMNTLLEALQDASDLAVAVSGGVDSLTLATLVCRHLQAPATLFHAVSPAVPGEATERVRALAVRESWALQIVDAGEFSDDRYRRNPVNRCFHCKTHLYDAIASRTSAQILSGTNLDDLGEYRPGLQAAKVHAVRHPFVEAGIDKQMVRRIAARLNLGEIADLPAAPCLSSRIETAIAIDPEVLAQALLGLCHQGRNGFEGRRVVAARCRHAFAQLHETSVVECNDLDLGAAQIDAQPRRHGFRCPRVSSSPGSGQAAVRDARYAVQNICANDPLSRAAWTDTCACYAVPAWLKQAGVNPESRGRH